MAIPPNIDRNRVPRHIAIIMDGNGRWAKSHGEERILGHNQGVKTVKTITELCAELGVDYLTLYAFSTENWKRPTDEVNALMDLLVHTISGEMKTLMENNIRLQTIGNTETLPEHTREELLGAIKTTSANTGLNLVLALSYSARWEITEAVKKIVYKATKACTERGEVSLLKPENITEQTISDHLTTAGMPDPELLIRTSGEQRISNFLLWQIAYTEIYITPVLWPDFNDDEFFKALSDYQSRERRFGLTSEQVKN